MRFLGMPARPARLAAAVGLGLGLIGFIAPAASAAPVAHAASHTGWLRLAHLSPNTPAVDVYLYSFGNPNARIVLKHVAYGTVSGYEAVPDGEYTVAMRGAGAKPSSKPVLSTTVDVRAGKTYTVAGMGPFSGLRLQILRDKLVTPKGKALVRVIQASLQQHTITVTADGKTIANKLRFSRTTSYKVVSPGTWNVRAVGPTGSVTRSITLAAGTIHTLVMLDNPGQLTIDDLVDAAGSRVLPAGSAATGFGGTARVPGASLLPWLAVLAAGLLVTVAGAARFRRSRGVR
jgi:Domain of unknown function (DUF4397)